MATPLTQYRAAPRYDDERLQPQAKRLRTSASQLSTGSALSGSASLLSEKSKSSELSDPSLEQCAHTTGDRPVFRHGVDFENLCHWVKHGNLHCCELDMADSVDRSFIELAMYMYTAAPTLSIEPKLSGLLVNMLNFFTEVYDPYNENPDKFDSQINLPFFDNDTLAMATDLALALDWQTRVIQKWSGKITSIQVSGLDEILDGERTAAVGQFITVMQCSLSTNLLTKSMSELANVSWNGGCNLTINCFSKISAVVGATQVGSANRNLMDALNLVPHILAPISNIDFERFYQYREVNFHDLDFAAVRPILIESARHMASQNLNARLELVGLVCPYYRFDAIFNDVLELLPAVLFTKTRVGIQSRGVFFQIFSTETSTIFTSYPFYRSQLNTNIQ